MKLYLKLIVIAIALLAVVIGLHFNFGSFVSDLYLQTQRKGSAIPADPTCPKGRYSKKTGGLVQELLQTIMIMIRILLKLP